MLPKICGYCPSFKSSNENYTFVLQCSNQKYLWDYEVIVVLVDMLCVEICLDVHMLVWTINCFDDCKNIVKI